MITCSWEKPIGTCVYVDTLGNAHNRIIWGGGNCLAITTTPNKALESFYIDKAHMKRCKISVNFYQNYLLFGDRATECKAFMDVLIKMGVPFSFTPTSKGYEHLFKGCDEE